LQDIQGQEDAALATTGGIIEGEKITRSTLEDEAREYTLHVHGTPEERFWQRQQSQAETILIGKGYIAKVCFDPQPWLPKQVI
jgi:anoctamin-10